MNLDNYYLRLILASAVILPASVSVAAKDSALAEGTWLRMETAARGVHSITHERLRQLGFANPRQVGVYGQGGDMLPYDFIDVTRRSLMPDDMEAVAVWHTDDCMYFYAPGTQSVSWDMDDKCFVNNGRNIYSDRGVYFLSDRYEPELMTAGTAPEEATVIEGGYNYICHEEDLQHNNNRAGQLFWGENLSEAAHPLVWPVNAPDCAPGDATVNFTVCVTPGIAASMTLGCNDASEKVSFRTGNTLLWSRQSHTRTFGIGEDGVARLSLSYASDSVSEAWVDHWTLTYPCRVPSLRDASGRRAAQGDFTATAAEGGVGGRFEVAGVPGAMALDVTDPRHPAVLHTEPSEGGTAIHIASLASARRIVVFDPSHTQLEPYYIDCQPLEPQNLHSLADKGAELLIITVPTLLAQAERLAQAHRDLQGIEVAVATVRQVYNEFSGGLPDPMAYRNMARMLHRSPGRKLENILFMGPLSADLRGVTAAVNVDEHIIALQNTQTSYEKASSPLLEYMGVMGDITSNLAFDRMTVDLGAGYLPCRFASEAETVVQKCIDHMSRTDWAATVGDWLTVGGIGDAHTHDSQASLLSESIDKLSAGGLVCSTLAIDTYGADEANRAYTSYLDRGKLFAVYFGHGAIDRMGTESDFFNSGDAARLTNTRLPLHLFGACNLTNLDRGQQGLAEAFVLGQEHGAVGAIAACRDTWAGQNFDFFKMFFTLCLHTDVLSTSDLRPAPATIGRIWAETLTKTNTSNELPYVLICDPALVMPMPLKTLRVTCTQTVATPGSKIDIKGSVMKPDGKNVDVTFQGEAVVKLMYPEVEMPIYEMESWKLPNHKKDDPLVTNKQVTYNDRLSTMVTVNVKNGSFRTSLPVSPEMAAYAGSSIPVYGTAYAPSSRTGATGMVQVKLPGKYTEPAVTDNTAPTVSDMVYDAAREELTVTAADEGGIALGSLELGRSVSLAVDGTPWRRGGTVSSNPDTGDFSWQWILPDLEPGEHSARFEVSDLSGNRTARELVFTAGRPKASLVLSLPGGVARRCAELQLEGMTSGDTWLHVCDTDGNEVYRTAVDGPGTLVWDLNGNHGQRVAKGLYKAYVRDSRGAYSDAVDIPVL